MMDLQTALIRLRNQEFDSVYLLQGTEMYLNKLFKTEITHQLMKTEDDFLNYSSFDLDETPLQQALTEAETLPFFGEYRLVFIEHPTFLTSERKSSNSIEHDLESLLHYLENPSPTTILVIIAAFEKLDERKKICKLLKKKATVIGTNPMKEVEIRKYVQQSIENEGYSIQPKAFEKLIQLTDLKLSNIMGELQKLFLYSTETKIITLESVENLVPKSLEHNVFDLVSEVLSGNSDKVMRLYSDLLLQGEETIKLNAVLLNQIRLFLQTKILASIGYQQANIVETLKVHPYRVKLALQQVRSFELKRLKELFDELVENDYRMKTETINKELFFELFLLKITNKIS